MRNFLSVLWEILRSFLLPRGDAGEAQTVTTGDRETDATGDRGAVTLGDRETAGKPPPSKTKRRDKEAIDEGRIGATPTRPGRSAPFFPGMRRRRSGFG